MMRPDYGRRSEADDWWSKLKAFDAFPKQREEAAEFFHRSTSGGVITLVAAALMTLLFFSELALYVRVRTVNELAVDTSRGETMQIHFDLTFPGMPCSWLSVDAMDVSGELHLDVEHEVFKQRLDTRGRPLQEHEPQRHEVGPAKHPAPGDASKEGDAAAAAAAASPPPSPPPPACGSCYGAEDSTRRCCNTCSEVREAYRIKGWALHADSVSQCAGEGYKDELEAQRGEGCRIYGDMGINKVAGNIHFAPGRSYQQGGMHIHDLGPFSGEQTFDLSHSIAKMAFGREYPGLRNPLDSVVVKQPDSPTLAPDLNGIPGGGIYQYFLKVVPTSYTTLGNSTIASNQYSVTEHFREPVPGGAAQLPGVFFFYDLSPIKVGFREERRSFGAFLTSACAIVGGVFTVSGIVDATIWAGQRAVRKKNELGKLI